jgi:hypothetical protein
MARAIRTVPPGASTRPPNIKSPAATSIGGSVIEVNGIPLPIPLERTPGAWTDSLAHQMTNPTKMHAIRPREPERHQPDHRQADTDPEP